MHSTTHNYYSVCIKVNLSLPFPQLLCFPVWRHLLLTVSDVENDVWRCALSFVLKVEGNHEAGAPALASAVSSVRFEHFWALRQTGKSLGQRKSLGQTSAKRSWPHIKAFRLSGRGKGILRKK